MALRVAFLLLLPSVAFSYPWLFADEYAPKAPNPCTAHPTKPDEGHFAVKADPTTKFTVTDGKGAPVKAVCPGVTYNLRVSFPQPRMLLASATTGVLGSPSVQQTVPARVLGACPNRFVYGRSAGNTPLPNFPLTIRLPCNAKGVSVKVSSATGSNGAFLIADVTLPLAASCPKC